MCLSQLDQFVHGLAVALVKGVASLEVVQELDVLRRQILYFLTQRYDSRLHLLLFREPGLHLMLMESGHLPV